MSRVGSGAVLLTVALLLPAANAEALDRFVDEDGTGTAPCTSTANPCPTITSGLTAAAIGDTVFVGGGTYNETLTLGISESIVASDFNPPLTADGPSVINAGAGIAVETPAYGAPGPESTIQGFTLRSTTTAVRLRSRATLRGNTFDSGGGNGVLAEDFGGNSLFGAVLDDNTFVDPDASGSQTAIQANTATSVAITDNSITGFLVGVDVQGGTPQILANTISDGHDGAGAGIRVIDSDPLITDNVLNLPAAAVGIDLSGTSTDAVLKRNQVVGGGAAGVFALGTNSVSMNGDVVINGSTFGLQLQDPTGGGVNEGDISGVNLTVAGYPTQAFTDFANLTLRESIIGDVPAGFAIGNNGGSCSLFDVRGPLEGGAASSCKNFAFNDNPGFVDLAGNDVHLVPSSAMIDRVVGANTEPDLDGDPRPTRGIDGDLTCTAMADIGADEYAPEVPFCAAPETTITAGPEGTTSDTTPSFEFASSKAPSTFECSVDAAAFAACTSPVTTSALALGAHSFAVRATERHGVVDATPATRDFSVGSADGTAPQTLKGKGPKRKSTRRRARFRFSSSEPGSTFECKLDRRAARPCESPRKVRHLKPGKHVFTAAAIDPAGNRDPTPARWRFRVLSD